MAQGNTEVGKLAPTLRRMRSVGSGRGEDPLLPPTDAETQAETGRGLSEVTVVWRQAPSPCSVPPTPPRRPPGSYPGAGPCPEGCSRGEAPRRPARTRRSAWPL